MSPSIFNADTTPLERGETMIEANAGTGKTYTLCRIVERLILEEEIPIERILAVTFTNSAADELRERIRQNLREKRNSLNKEDKKARNLLARALANFDDARLYTLHAFCKRLLSEFSFECGVRPESELITQDKHLLRQVALDFRRFYFANCDPFCSALSFTGKLTTEGLQEILETADKDEDCNPKSVSNKEKEPPQGTVDQPEANILESTSSSPGEPREELTEEEFKSLAKQAFDEYLNLSRIWASEINKITEFLNEYAANGYKPRNVLPELTRRFGNALDKQSSDFPDFALIKLVRNTLNEEIKIKKDCCEQKPSFFDSALAFCEICKRLEAYLTGVFIDFGEVKLRQLKDRLNLRTFNDLQELVAVGLEGKRGSSLAKKVFSQYDAALVDEFQDTDPLQFDILRKLFSPDHEGEAKRIYYIGDPKQSIYKFRGADLNNYLQIREEMEKGKIRSLVTNYRTHPLLVEATNQFLTMKSKTMNPEENKEGLFMDERISFIESKGHLEKADEKLFRREAQDLPEAPFNLRYCPKAEKNEKPKDAEKAVLNDLTGEILKLLDPNKKTYIGERSIKGSDIAVLCRSNKEADAVQQVLCKHQIPCVLLANRSIFKTEEALHFKYLMEALLAPNDIGKVRRVLVLPFFSLCAQTLENFGEDPGAWDFWANRFSDWAQLWTKQGFSYALQTILKDDFETKQSTDEQTPAFQPIQQKILGEKGGERRMTNYLHLGEILYQAEQSVSSSFPRNLYLWYVQQMETNVDVDEADSRLESDEDAVQILTIHKAKGLEFQVTFLPFCWKIHPSDSKAENQQENVRTLYVALTRASSRLYVYLRQPNKQFKNSSLSRCLPDELQQALEVLGQNQQLFNFSHVSTAAPEGSYLPENSETDMNPIEFSGIIPSGYMSSSFSQKTKGEEKEKDLDDEEPAIRTVSPKERLGAHAFPAGTTAGNFFHEVFENVPFDGNDHSTEIEQQLRKHGLEKADKRIAEEMVNAALNTVLDKHLGDAFKLSEIPDSNRIAEMEFHLHAPDFSFIDLGKALEQAVPENNFANYLMGKQVEGTLSDSLRFFKGFIDLTFRHGSQYFILDWKSNLLSGEQQSFATANLLHAMNDADYLLQYHLYSLALHRFLRESLGSDYDYDEHFGGVYYLFIRGMHNPEQRGDGVFFDCPSRKLLERMDRYFMKQGDPADE